MDVVERPHSQIAPGYGVKWHRQLQETGWWHSFELPDGRIVAGVNSVESLKNRISQFPIPGDLSGKRVLDIGAWDGWFSFEMERRGADVIAIDCFDNPRFREMHSIYNSRVDYRQMDVMDVTPNVLGRFDVVLFLGVLYHLKHPLMALERVCAVAADLVAIDSYVLRDDFDSDAQAVLHFYETNEMEGQTDNWCAPNLACLMAMCRTAGFARVEFRNVLPYSACVACYRRWGPKVQDGPHVELLTAVNALDGGINFQAERDAYLACGFRAEERSPRVKNVQPAVSGFGVRPISVTNVGDGLWQANFKLPPGLSPGWHEVDIAVGDGPSSSGCRIAIDVPLPECKPEIEGVRDATTAADHTLDLRAGRMVSLWCSGLPNNADRNNVRVLLNRASCRVDFVAPVNTSHLDSGVLPEFDSIGARCGRLQRLRVVLWNFLGHRTSAAFKEIRQINVRVPNNVPTGLNHLVVSVGTFASKPHTLRVLA